ncbi:hypothetical protein HDU76_013096 [Blyttiomyces sp. JEL0837]|nr:hypothetical protein HDU76_013096 [Blyttiomyces sp. JEL0837]
MAWSESQLESIQIVHRDTVVKSSGYFARTLTSYKMQGQDAEFVLQLKPNGVTTARPPIVSIEKIVPSAPVVSESNSFDVMISYDWCEGKELAVKLKENLNLQQFRVWIDEEQMDGNMFQRMAEGVDKSLVVAPVLTVAYSKSYYCELELCYAANLKKPLKPARFMKSNEDLPNGWAKFITSPLKYYDFSDKLQDSNKFNALFVSLCNDIRKSMEERQNIGRVVGGAAVRSVDPLVQWLQPTDFKRDLEKFKGDYIPITRRWAIENVDQWLTTTEDSLLWLNGGTAFFCKHDDNTKNNAIRIVSTIAFDLASKLPEYRAFLVSAMENEAKNFPNREISVLDMPSTAFQHLIINGLETIQKPSKDVVIIIDALDEIGKDYLREDFLNVIRYKMNDLPNWVRVFTTTRPEMDGLNCSILSPQDEHNLDDNRVFVRHQFLLRLSVADKEPDGERLTELVEIIASETGGVFHYARLACNSLTSRSYRSWDEVLQVASEFNGGLDQIYSRVLKEAFDGADAVVYERFRKVMGVVVTAEEPLHQNSIARLVGLALAEVGGIILRIQSILNISSGAIHVLHKSLKDYLSSHERCDNAEFCIDTISFHTIMANSSLQIMTAGLSRNMANLKDETVELSASASLNIIDSCLEYCCKFWASHLLVSKDIAVAPSLHLFCSKSL